MSEKTRIEQAVEQFLEHGFEEHVLGNRNKTNEFTNSKYGRNLGMETPEDLKRLALDTLNDVGTRAITSSKDGSHLYFYNERDNVFISIEPKGGGSVYRPPDGGKYFDRTETETGTGSSYIHCTCRRNAVSS